jgi:hypothetical protein
MDTPPDQYTAFDGRKLLCRGSLSQVVLKVKKKADQGKAADVLIFSDSTGKSMDFNFQGSESDVLKRLDVFVARASPAAIVGNDGEKSVAGPGRPKLGVMSREVSLLPRHWEWLATQSGGASATLRKLVEEARKKSQEGRGDNQVKIVQERAYKFMSILAGDLPGYEEALRALYRKDRKVFAAKVEDWPAGVRDHALELAGPAFTE